MYIHYTVRYLWFMSRRKDNFKKKICFLTVIIINKIDNKQTYVSYISYISVHINTFCSLFFKDIVQSKTILYTKWLLVHDLRMKQAQVYMLFLVNCIYIRHHFNVQFYILMDITSIFNTYSKFTFTGKNKKYEDL